MHIDYRLLKARCLEPINAFKAKGTATYTRDGILISNCHKNNKVLAVAHLDSVLGLKHFYINRINGTDYVFNAQLDDRLGAYIILDLLPAMGLKYDILLTEGEERGRSTAAHFNPDKQYNWMFSFDRRGDDVVMYEYQSENSLDLLKRYKFRPDFGSFSDICWLNHLNCVGFNFGTGYHGEHTDLCYADMSVTLRQISKFIRFFGDQKNTVMPWDESQAFRFKYSKAYTYTRYTRSDLDDWGDTPEDDSPLDLECEFCGNPLEKNDMPYGCCESCALGNGIFCDCSSRISVEQAVNQGCCDSCLPF